MANDASENSCSLDNLNSSHSGALVPEIQPILTTLSNFSSTDSAELELPKCEIVSFNTFSTPEIPLVTNLVQSMLDQLQVRLGVKADIDPKTNDIVIPAKDDSTEIRMKYRRIGNLDTWKWNTTDTEDSASFEMKIGGSQGFLKVQDGEEVTRLYLNSNNGTSRLISNGKIVFSKTPDSIFLNGESGQSFNWNLKDNKITQVLEDGSTETIILSQNADQILRPDGTERKLDLKVKLSTGETVKLLKTRETQHGMEADFGPGFSGKFGIFSGQLVMNLFVDGKPAGENQPVITDQDTIDYLYSRLKMQSVIHAQNRTFRKS